MPSERYGISVICLSLDIWCWRGTPEQIWHDLGCWSEPPCHTLNPLCHTQGHEYYTLWQARLRPTICRTTGHKEHYKPFQLWPLTLVTLRDPEWCSVQVKWNPDLVLTTFTIPKYDFCQHRYKYLIIRKSFLLRNAAIKWHKPKVDFFIKGKVRIIFNFKSLEFHLSSKDQVLPKKRCVNKVTEVAIMTHWCVLQSHNFWKSYVSNN